MLRKVLSCCIAASFAVISTSSQAQQNEVQGFTAEGQTLAPLVSAPESQGVEGQYIVVLKQPLTLASNPESIQSFTQQTVSSLETEQAVKIEKVFDRSISGFVATLNAEQLRSLRADQRVEFIEQDRIISIDPVVSANANQSNAIWGLDRIDQRDLPLNRNYNYNFDGTGVTAYVIDTGVTTTHPEFGGRAVSGYDFVDNDADSTDCNGHGTHVAGTIGGTQYGVAKNVNIVGVRVLGCTGNGSTSGVIAGVDWVAANASGPSVANMSLGGGVSTALDRAVANAVQSGVSFMLAAGNSNADACNSSPAREPSGVTVGSTTSSDSRSSFSNWGSCVDVFAPGSSIKSAWFDGSYKTISGTSMATPHVAGVAALYLQENGALSPAQVSALISNRASVGKVSDTKGSVNKLVYSQVGSGCDTNCPNPGDGQLKNGQAETGIAVSRGEKKHYYIDVPAGRSLSVTISGGSGDADLYTRFGAQPTTSTWDCRPYRWGNSETCTVPTTKNGRYYIMLNGYSTASGVTLKASY
ncbi:S8 family peptidase [Vibrio nigripulchritudo]|uniref:S8 family peptidase n=1 Tax=Vibrio nigripulchritudo TaxID=28173 RepID=UPI002491E492|nr:S8 family peptidase [Vibrio nigripulchritudo]BDU39340.1 alkaline serine protease [Vibrio nigripulchritudo]BDU45060.1 alkaline serine protease [Vibrio nigripulchritudo]